MGKFEYITISSADISLQDEWEFDAFFVEPLTEFGKDGWEVVCSYRDANEEHTNFLLKRQV
tara:strand:- start:1156 stop:1338 length:183 start_codon:yes stop_codon:yes gene_type:complete